MTVPVMMFDRTRESAVRPPAVLIPAVTNALPPTVAAPVVEKEPEFSRAEMAAVCAVRGPLLLSDAPVIEPALLKLPT